MGWRGALYAWESADTGAETTPEQVIGPDRQVVDILCGKQEQHISADVAYAVWQYWQATGDEDFLLDAGAEIILETGRFWSSRARLEPDGLRHIRGVIGPDEYHEHIDDNAYTNVMARWNIRRALDVAAVLRERWPARWTRFRGSTRLDDAELRQWRTVADDDGDRSRSGNRTVRTVRWLFRLSKISTWRTYAGRSVPMDVVLGRDRIQRSQVVKQADVVALLGLLPEEFPLEAAARTSAITNRAAVMAVRSSPAMHGLVAARLGEADMALRYFRQTAAIDLTDTQVGDRRRRSHRGPRRDLDAGGVRFWRGVTSAATGWRSIHGCRPVGGASPSGFSGVAGGSDFGSARAKLARSRSKQLWRPAN